MDNWKLKDRERQKGDIYTLGARQQKICEEREESTSSLNVYTHSFPPIPPSVTKTSYL